MAVKHKVIDCQDSRADIIIRVLEQLQQERSLGNVERENLCRAIVTNFNMIVPLLQSSGFKLPEKAVDDYSQTPVDENLVLHTLKALYNELSDPEKQPGPELAVFLQLIDLKFIPNAVKWMLNSGFSDPSLKRVLMTLCFWLGQKETCSSNLGPLVLEFMKGLEADQYYDILEEVTIVHISNLFSQITKPDLRKFIGPVVIHMMQRMHHNQKAFHKIVPYIHDVLQSLGKENSETSQHYLKNIINLMVTLMEQFPNYPQDLNEILKPFANYPNIKQSLNSSKLWFDNSNSAVYPFRKVGLNNLGNTCYMNSVLQALFMTKLFRNDVLMIDLQNTGLFTKLQALFTLLQFSERSSLSPTEMAAVARPPGFQIGHQHDSSEFLGYILDVLHEQESVFNSSRNSVEDVAGAADERNAVTVVKKSFGGRTLSLSQCNSCGSRSERVDTFRDLQLSFPNSTDNQSVQKLLDYYLQPEKLCGDNQYHCDTCRGLTDGERVTKIIEPPARLVLTLKHFRYDPISQLRTKLLQRVNLNSDLTLEATQYKLYAAVVHCGSSVDSGHYYTYAKDDNEWYKFNDCFVNKSKAEELNELCPPEAPYVLFYSRNDYAEPISIHRCDLPEKLKNVIIQDLQEVEYDRKRTQMSFKRNHDRDNDDDPPPPRCGGGGFLDSSANRFVC